MLTYELTKQPGLPLYESLYRCLREDILTGRLAPGVKLPSKRALAENLKVSKTTVEAAYSQLTAEGFLRSREKVGYFVENTQHHAVPAAITPPAEAPARSAPVVLDLTGGGSGHFPFSAWRSLQREVILDFGEKLLLPLPNRGIPELRQAIAAHLAAFRGMTADPENILVGAGTDFLCNLLVQLLGRDRVYAVEEPGYGKIRRIYTAAGASCIEGPMDSRGVRPESLADAGVLHISPSHHFPTGLVTPMDRRQALIDWAEAGGNWIIEDDYDSEFRFRARPLPAMQSMAPDRVIYMNTFSKSLAPSIRISYLVLPPALMARFRQTLGFYSCTVPSFEQYTLARFLSRGYFEKHINRMRKFYQTRRNRLISLLRSCPAADKLTILERDAGLHFLLRVDTALSDRAMEERLADAGIRVRTLSSFYHTGTQDLHTLVIHYAGSEETAFPALIDALTALVASS